MCGIIGYTGKKQAANILADAMKRLEYRGYDSAGIATVSEEGLNICKDEGTISDIARVCSVTDMPGCTGIGHVRWATHGGINRLNAHPHTDTSGEIAVIHNGIIDNYE